MKKGFRAFLLALFALSYSVSPSLAASSKAKLITDTSSNANTVPFINAGPAEDSTAATALAVQVGGTEMMRVTASGYVGIGTSSPQAPLDIGGGVKIGSSSAGCDSTKAGMIQYAGGMIQYCNGGAWITFGNSGSGSASSLFQVITATVTGANGGTATTSCPAGYVLMSYGAVVDQRTQNGTNGWLLGTTNCKNIAGSLFASLTNYASGSTQSIYSCMGLCVANGIDGVNYLGASASSTGPSRNGDVTTGLFSDTASTVSIATSGVERLRVTATGSVGIGRTAPASALHVQNSGAATQITIGDTSTGHTFGAISTSADVGGSFNIQSVGTSGTSYGNLVLQAVGGNVGIGTTSPAVPLDIGGGFAYINGTSTYQLFNSNDKIIQVRGANQAVISLLSDVNVAGGKIGGLYFGRTLGQGDAWRNLIGIQAIQQVLGGISYADLTIRSNLGGELMRINGSNGNMSIAGALTQGSDLRLKKDVQPIKSALDKLTRLRGVTFHWEGKNSDPAEQMGVIAQEVQAVFPQLVKKDKNAMLSVNYSGLVAPLIDAVKDLKAENDNLRAQNAAFAARLDALEARGK